MEATSCLETIDNQKKKMAKLSFSTEFCKFDCAVSVTQGSHTRISPCLPACQVGHCHSTSIQALTSMPTSVTRTTPNPETSLNTNLDCF